MTADRDFSLLERVAALADVLRRMRLPLAAAGCIGIVLVAAGIVDGRASGLGLAGLVLLIWTSFFAALGQIFGGREWHPPAAGARLADRLRWRAVRALAWLALAGMAALAGLLILFTLRALSAA